MKEKQITCANCGKLIAKGFVEIGSIQIPCKCGVLTRIEATHKPEGRQIMAVEPERATA